MQHAREKEKTTSIPARHRFIIIILFLFPSKLGTLHPGTPRAVLYNSDVRSVKLDRLVDAVLTSPPYPGVYDYLSFARKVRAGSGTATAAMNRGGGEGAAAGGAAAAAAAGGEASGEGDGGGVVADGVDGGVDGVDRERNTFAETVVPGSDVYFRTAVPADRSWPTQWTEVGSSRMLPSP